MVDNTKFLRVDNSTPAPRIFVDSLKLYKFNNKNWFVPTFRIDYVDNEFYFMMAECNTYDVVALVDNSILARFGRYLRGNRDEVIPSSSLYASCWHCGNNARYWILSIDYIDRIITHETMNDTFVRHFGTYALVALPAKETFEKVIGFENEEKSTP